MTCSNCRGMGRYYSQPFPGAWEVNPCLCEASATIREQRKRKYEEDRKIYKQRIQEARERFGYAGQC